MFGTLRARKVQVITGNGEPRCEPRCFPGVVCFRRPRMSSAGQIISKSVESLLQADSDSPQGEGEPIMGCPLKPCSPGYIFASSLLYVYLCRHLIDSLSSFCPAMGLNFPRVYVFFLCSCAEFFLFLWVRTPCDCRPSLVFPGLPP